MRKCPSCNTENDSMTCSKCSTATKETDNSGMIIGAAVGFMEDGLTGAVLGGIIGSMFDD